MLTFFFFSTKSRRNTVQGTFLYMPPEAITMKKFGSAMDIWATGTLLLVYY